MKYTLYFFATLTIVLAGCTQHKVLPYQNPKLPVEIRVEDLVARMTLEEKASQMVYDAPAIERLGIPAYNWWNECLHGVARAGKATVFPQAIGMAASWDRDLLFRMADVTSTEARAKYRDFSSRDKRGIYQGLTFWSPNINIFRDPRWGRGMETYGEDPYLTGELGTRFVEGLQGDDKKYFKVIATSKHYVVHSGPEPIRHSFDAVISDRDFRDTYLPAFKKTVQKGKAYSVMCAYNRYMGEPCCGSDEILNNILRNELGFKGYIVSDCGAIYDFYTGHMVVEDATEAAALGVQAGTDLNCGDVYMKIVDAVNDGLLSEEDVDRAVKRLFTARMKLGMFDPDEMVPYTDITYDTVACPTHKDLAAEMARESIVLLKNAGGLLPLSPENKKIAVIGPNADDVEVMYGNYNGTPTDPVTPLAGIRKFTEGKAEVKYAQGSPHAEGLAAFVTVPGNVLFTGKELDTNGLTARYFSGFNTDTTAVSERIEKEISVNWWDDNVPAEGLVNDSFSVVWEGILFPDVSGSYSLGCEAKYFELYIDGKLIAGREDVHHPRKISKEIKLKKGVPYAIKVKAADHHGDSPCRLIWSLQDKNYTGEAMEIAEWADEIIMVMGLSPRLEGEEMKVDVEGFSGGDRLTLDLPEIQQELISKVQSLNKPMVMVLLNGSALSIGQEAKNVPAIVEAWYPGEAGGTAIADVLFGSYNPAGRLPVTFYNSVNDLPDFEDYNMKGRTYRYYEGEVLYPFGYGLSYTTFAYSNLKPAKEEINAGEDLHISVDISNTGKLDGDEVAQLYLSMENADPARPFIELKGFERIHIKAGESQTVRFTVPADELAWYDEDQGAYIVHPGIYHLYAGGSSDRNNLLSTDIKIVE